MDFTRLITELQPPAGGESAVRHRSALVDTVNADGTVDLDFNGTVVPDVSVLQGAAVVAGATVQVAAWAGDLLVLGMVAGYQTAYGFGETVYFTTSDTFDKVDFPGVREVKVRCLGAGGGGGSAAATAAGQASVGQPGDGGSLAEMWVLAGLLAGSETITVGAAGSGGTTGSGGSGGNSSFGAHCVGNGGTGGSRVSALSFPNASNGRAGTTTGTGDLIYPGGGCDPIFFPAAAICLAPDGGHSVLGRGGLAQVTTTNFTGGTGTGFGSGGSGGGNAQSQGASQNGAAGRPGVVIVDIYF